MNCNAAVPVVLAQSCSLLVYYIAMGEVAVAIGGAPPMVAAADAASSSSNVTYETIYGWVPSSSIIDWETLAVETWSELADCNPETTTPPICSDCGLGAIVIEYDEIDDGNNATEDGGTVDFTNDDGTQYSFSYRTYMIGGGGSKGPNDYNTKSFEIASFTKAITALTMEVMIKEGSVTGDMTIEDYLPECDWAATASSSGEIGTITFEELRLHTSGLPPQPPNRKETGNPGDNPFGGYTLNMLCDSLMKISNLPTRGRYSYGNYAYGILGYVLTRAEAIANGTPVPTFEDLVRAKVLLPMDMNTTVVEFDPDTAAKACGRGEDRDKNTIRLGKYGVLAGNGALRSTLPDMGKFMMHAMMSNFSRSYTGHDDDAQMAFAYKIMGDSIQATKSRGGIVDACPCVSDWCEGWLCPLPSEEGLEITSLGVEYYTSGGVNFVKKSGDSGGYSCRGAWSGRARRGAYVVDTCGGCGSFQTQGSGAQRLALILANGPIDDGVVSSALSPPSEDSVIDYDGMFFEGNAGSKAFPSEARINVEIRKNDDDGDGDSEPTYTVYMASSDGMGCTSKAKVINGGLQLEKSALYGCGWSTIDPLVTIPQPYKLLLLDDGIGATYQTQGFDIYLSMGDSRTGSGDMVGDDVYLKALYDDRSSADTGGRRGTIRAAGLLSMVLVALATCYV